MGRQIALLADADDLATLLARAEAIGLSALAASGARGAAPARIAPSAAVIEPKPHFRLFLVAPDVPDAELVYGGGALADGRVELRFWEAPVVELIAPFEDTSAHVLMSGRIYLDTRCGRPGTSARRGYDALARYVAKWEPIAQPTRRGGMDRARVGPAAARRARAGEIELGSAVVRAYRWVLPPARG